MKYLLFLLLFSLQNLCLSQKTLTPESLWTLGRESLEDLSSDGRSAVYTVSRYSTADNTGNSQIYFIDLRSNLSTVLTQETGHCQNVRFRPNSKRIGFILGGLMYEMDYDGQNRTAMSSTEMNGFAYSPKGDKILFI
ncbi:MAG: hypothetical protein ABIV51_06975, partial [Saprospiraceae bacterium]